MLKTNHYFAKNENKANATKLNEGTEVEILLPQSIKENYSLPDPALLQIYEDRSNRILWLLGDVSEEQGYDWVDFILRCNREDRGVAADDRKPIKLIVANYGGSLEMARTLISIIEISKTPIYGYAIGPVCSAASMIFLACQKKFALPTAYLMIHKGSCQQPNADYNTLMAAMDDYKKQIEELIQFYISHTTFTEAEIRQNIEKDWYIYTKEALEKGMCDALVSDIDELL